MNCLSRWRTTLLLARTLLAILATTAWLHSEQGQETADQLEVRRAILRAIPTAARISGDMDAFFAHLRPYGPLDLVIEKSSDPKYSGELRNFFLGVMVGAAEIDEDKLFRSLDEFHCGPPCARARIASLRSKLESIRDLVHEFRKLQAVSVLALWPGDGYRVGSFAHDGESFFELLPSPILGLIPWETKPVADEESIFDQMKTSRSQIAELLAAMKDAGLTATIRDRDAVRVMIIDSIGDNEAGLLFINDGARRPRKDDWLINGSQLTGIEKVAKGIYFYTSS